MIREYKNSDPAERERVMEIWLSANLDAHGFIREAYWRECYDYTAEAIGNAEVYVAEEDEQIAGFIGLDGDNIEGIFVDADCRCRGVGKSLIDFVKERHTKLTLCVYEKNERAAEFYKREGFVSVRKKPDISTGETEILMRWVSRRVKFDLSEE